LYPYGNSGLKLDKKEKNSSTAAQLTNELAARGSVDEVDASDVQDVVKILVREIRLIWMKVIRPRPQFPS